MAKSNFLSEIRWYNVSTAKQGDTAEMVKFAKRAAKLANNRLYKLEKAGLASRVTTGGVKHINLANIKDKQSAARAISKVKSVLANPLSNVGAVRKQFRQAEAEYGKSGRMKFIAEEVEVRSKDPVTGETIVRHKLVPKAVPWGTNTDAKSWVDTRKMIKNFWDWYNKVGNSYLSSKDAYDIWENNNYDNRSAIEQGEEQIGDASAAAWEQYQDQMTDLYGSSQWM